MSGGEKEKKEKDKPKEEWKTRDLLPFTYSEYPSLDVKWRYVIQGHWRGRSVTDRTPVIIRVNGKMKVVPIGYLWTLAIGNGDVRTINGIEVWTSKGFKPIIYISRHKIQPSKDLIRVNAFGGIVEVTKDHSLFQDGKPIEAGKLKVGDKIDLIDVPHLPFKYAVDLDYAYTLGLFLAEGSIKKDGEVKLTNRNKQVFNRVKSFLKRYGITYWEGEDYLGFIFPPFKQCLLENFRIHTETKRHARCKIIPDFVFEWDRASLEALIEGFLAGDRLHRKCAKYPYAFAVSSQALAQGLYIILCNLYPHIEFSIFHDSGDKVRVIAIDPKHNLTKPRNIIRKIIPAKSCLAFGEKNPNYKHGKYCSFTKYRYYDYILYNSRRFVYDIETETHDFLGGVGKIRCHNSVHKDLRFVWGNHLIGYTILDNPPDMPEVDSLEKAKKVWKERYKDFSFRPEIYNKKCRIEHKSKQPLSWLSVEGVVEPGGIGATRFHKGVFHIIDTGEFWPGAIKPYFQEFFLNGKLWKNWERIIFRAVKVPVLDPVTKKPIPHKHEIMMFVMHPKDQVPYALKRGIERGFVPPKNYIPFVVPYHVEKYPEKVWNWILYMNDGEFKKNTLKYHERCSEWLEQIYKVLKKKLPKDELEKLEEWKEKGFPMSKWKKYPYGLVILAKAKYSIAMHTWKGQTVIRNMPNLEFYLRIDDGKSKIRSWMLPSNPLRYDMVPCIYEGRIDRKYFDWEGRIPPGKRYNPTKKLNVDVVVLTTGNVDIEVVNEKGREKLMLTFKSGKMKGKYWLIQEEKGGDVYFLQRVREFSSDELIYFDFAKYYLIRHTLHLKDGDKSHYEIDVPFEEGTWKIEMVKDPRELKKGESVPAIIRVCEDKDWVKRKEAVINGIKSTIEVLGTGDLATINLSDYFVSMNLTGVLNGLYVLIKENGVWFFERSKLPLENAEDPLEGMHFDEFKVRKYKNTVHIHIYDARFFTRCEPDWREYLPDLKVPKGVLDILVCLYPVPGTLPHARIQRIIIDPEEANVDDIIKWIKKERLYQWVSKQIRK